MQLNGKTAARARFRRNACTSREVSTRPAIGSLVYPELSVAQVRPISNNLCPNEFGFTQISAAVSISFGLTQYIIRPCASAVAAGEAVYCRLSDNIKVPIC